MQAYFKTYKKNEIKKLDELDIKIILLVYMNVKQCSYIATFLDCSKQVVNQRVAKLIDRDIMMSIDNPQKWFYKNYELKENVKMYIKSVVLNTTEFNLSFLIYTCANLIDT
jgi:hypothetical protein